MGEQEKGFHIGIILEFDPQNSYFKSWVQRCVPVIPAQGRWREEAP